jgi:dihydrofolate synthase/folylpolyglutamate synthase
VIVTPYLLNPRAVPADELVEIVRSLTAIPAERASSPAEAWALAQQGAGPDDLICVSGSFFLAAEFRELLTAAPPSSPPTPSEDR